ncbi:MAG: dihydrofolate synthase/folylpolyglutamate synthase [Saprospiraceae bacterium]|jgi:dihydrofolate synthase/folylpolyglutamate synthase
MQPRDVNIWLDYIQTLHSRTIEMGLQRVTEVWQKCELSINCPVITVAGTNGKGSSVGMLEAIYRKEGYKTGSYTSPHLVHYNERITIAGEPIGDAELIAGFESIESVRREIPLTYFEFGTVLALYCLQQANVDIMILEVGLGGRLDATNIIANDVALITSISVDHVSWLGNDREVIGAEKAGIIKPNGIAVFSGMDRPVSIDNTATAQGAKLFAAGRDFNIRIDDGSFDWEFEDHSLINVETNLIGDHQMANASGVLTAIHLLNEVLPVTESNIRLGLNSVTICARQQWIEGEPCLLLDVSHNEDSIEQLVETLQEKLMLGDGKIHAVFGALEDKNISQAINQLLPIVDKWYLASIAGDRGQSAEALLQNLNQTLSLEAELHDAPVAAFRSAKKAALSIDIVLIFGSFHIVGDILADLS